MSTQQQQDTEIDQILRSRDPAQTSMPRTELHQQQLVMAISRADSPARKRHRWAFAPVAVVTALVAGLAVSGAVPALADTVQRFVAETGLFGDGAGPHGASSGKHYLEMDGSQWINLSAEDFPTYAVQLMPAYITLPDTVSRARFASDIAAGLAGDNGTGRGAVMQVSGIRRFFEVDAQCVWYQTWQIAVAHGDTALAVKAAAQYDAATRWPEIVATDGGGVVASMHRVHALAEAGDWAGARAELGTDCTPADVASVTR